MSNNHDTSVVAVLGCGTIGASWAEAFRAAGRQVQAWDPQPAVRARLAAQTGVRVMDTAAAAVAGAGFVQESGPEDLRVKRELFSTIASSLEPDAIVASSTSTIPATRLQADCPFAGRVIVGHPFNPPHLLPLVEVVGGEQAAPSVVDRAMDFYAAVGKRPIRLRTERAGHLANRLQAALWREAVDAVASGQASVEDVDAAVTTSLGPRWALLGPFATFHLGGGDGGLAHFLDHIGRAFEDLWDDAKRPQVTAELKQRLVAETLAEAGGRTVRELAAERDRGLVQILALTQPRGDR